MKVKVWTILVTLTVLAVPIGAFSQILSVESSSLELDFNDRNWEGAGWCYNNGPNSWFPDVIDGVATFARNDYCWGQVRTIIPIELNQEITLEIQPFLTTGGVNEDGAMVGFSDGWAIYDGRFVGLRFQYGNIYLYDYVAHVGLPSSGAPIIGSYSPGQWLSLRMKVTTEGVYELSGTGISATYTIDNVWSQFRFNIAMNDSYDGINVKDVRVSTVQTVALDIKPGSCPNPLNVRRAGKYMEDECATSITSTGTGLAGKRQPWRHRNRGVVPVAICGSEGFDVSAIDATSVTLVGITAERWAYEDVSTAVFGEGEECVCPPPGGDGYTDLTLKFDATQIIEALGEVYDGDILRLKLTGRLMDGTEFEGYDCVLIIHDSYAQVYEPTLLGNYPNPFNPSTQISFYLPEASEVSLDIFNVIGRKVSTVADGFFEAGEHTVEWDGSEAASGIYFYRLNVGYTVDKKKMVLLK